ncbi:FG-GAP-like repeat-containing protein [Actinopolymorpha singaporensis]|uniref:FG-GAP repeat-containing protein n=1 Tax=Actinopolymorpha singaporensis TaxID=117157 RepID=A0A1H1S4G8_9ACTN|nr:FG-GAP-like repeat-containing protein [Actinopolymorpha singaporensis]SDS42139.1 FG-GAP repeat-containing protein [Actinopolymorpha singaporensis]
MPGMRSVSRRVWATSIAACLPTVMVGAAAIATPAATPTPALTPARVAAPSDFNGDGSVDLALGSQATVAGFPFAGMVPTVYGTGTTLNPAKRQRIDESLPWVPGTPQQDEGFGSTLASADFNADGFADLAVCAPTETENGFGGVGALYILFGTSKGLTRASRVVSNCDEVAAGRFNGDGLPDLAILGDQPKVMYGSATLSNPGGIVLKNFGATGGALFGRAALASGDLNHDGFSDVVYTVSRTRGVVLQVYFGGAGGLGSSPSQLIATSLSTAASIGDINGDGFGDLAVGSPTEPVGGHILAGQVRVWYGSASGLNLTRGVTVINQDSPGVPGGPEAGDYFGYSVALGDATGDRRADLAIGVPFEDIGTVVDAGYATVILGAAGGLNLTTAKPYQQGTGGVPGTVRAGNEFGWAMVFRDFNRDNRADLVVTAVGTNANQGLAMVLTGTTTGVVGPGVFPVLTPQTLAFPAPARAFFGVSLSR